jgi:hypothetical protein
MKGQALIQLIFRTSSNGSGKKIVRGSEDKISIETAVDPAWGCRSFAN